MLVVLALIDVVMISNLLIMVIVGGYETFVSRMNLEGHRDQPEWLSHVNASVLKVKLATAIIGISSIHLLKTFINADNYTDRVLIAQTAIHITFLLSAMAIALHRQADVAAARPPVTESAGVSGPVMFSGTTHWSNCSAVRWPEAIAASRRLRAFLVRLLRDLGGLVVADVRVERRHQHQRALHQLGDALAVGLDADRAVVVEAAPCRRPAGARSAGSCGRSSAGTR